MIIVEQLLNSSILYLEIKYLQVKIKNVQGKIM